MRVIGRVIVSRTRSTRSDARRHMHIWEDLTDNRGPLAATWLKGSCRRVNSPARLAVALGPWPWPWQWPLAGLLGDFLEIPLRKSPYAINTQLYWMDISSEGDTDDLQHVHVSPVMLLN